ncbi:MAG: hypothetical protein K0R54_5251 [Clostridiaceae bacterium]|nr:hypothetical protein [Clostridiaceae bacterium]
MKHRFMISISTIVVISTLLFGCSAGAGQVAKDSVNATNLSVEVSQISSYGSSGAKDDTELNKENMLTYAIEDEYLARKEYEVIMNKYGTQKPFSNIIKAEEHHISYLKALFEKYNIPIPEDKASNYAAIPVNLTEAYKVGVNAEIENINMYDRFLKEDAPQDIKDTFIALRDASKNHLDAFEKQVRVKK